ncbi:MAG TPA: class I SAM-dependent methyltransferase [Solirubrobacterales bacterium]
MQNEATVEGGNAAEAGQAGYTRRFLPFYDLFVLGYTLPVLWRCPKKRIRRLYDENVGVRHLDIGVASGYLIDKCRFPTETPEITLMDMNPNSLRFAARRLRRYSPRTCQGNVLEPWPLSGQSFDSIAMSNLLHCVPGTLRDKAVVFDHAREALAPGGTVFGATVLGREADHTKRSLKMMERVNQRGGFSNLDDRREDLEAALVERFHTHDVEVVGVVALFTASNGN